MIQSHVQFQGLIVQHKFPLTIEELCGGVILFITEAQLLETQS